MISIQVLPYSVPGYEGCKTLQINYTIPNGVQGPEHPNPGQRYHGTSRTAYLPDTQEGREVLQVHTYTLMQSLLTSGHGLIRVSIYNSE